MAIEFTCPYCTALIRVPDSAGGGKGRCPKCATRISVPKVSAAKKAAPSVDEPDLFTGPPTDDPTGANTDTASVGSAAVQFAPAEDSAPADMFVPAPRPLGELPVETPRQPLRPGSVASKLKRKKKSSGWLIPVGFGAVLCGVFGWFLWQQYQSDRLVGELTAETAATLELPPAIVSKASLRESEDELKTLLGHLEKSPVRLPSSLMLVEIGGSRKGLSIRVTSGLKTQFYRVDVQRDPALMKYRADHAFELEETRSKEVDAAAGMFITEYQRVVNKKADANALNDFRDGLALPALVRGLGHEVVAVYGQNLFPCVYEDKDGALYFLLPPGAQGFELIGRKHKDGSTVFPGTYTVKVKGEIKHTTKAEPDESKDKDVDKADGKKKAQSMEPDESSEMKESSPEMKDPKDKKTKPKMMMEETK
jgi:predicted Zn finger-like uncharacterized protein